MNTGVCLIVGLLCQFLSLTDVFGNDGKQTQQGVYRSARY